MNDRTITHFLLEAFRTHLIEAEKSAATIEKYMRDVKYFVSHTAHQPVSKQTMMDYKARLAQEYAITSANSMLASLNAFLRFAGWLDLCVRQFKVQRQAFVPEEKELSREEYERLVKAARDSGNERLQLILQTICATGIRVSELAFINVEAVRQGEAMVQCKGKLRPVFIVSKLRTQLLAYAQKQKLVSGPLFVTRGGKPVSRTAIWRDMKALCKQANVSPGKVFPHNLRHLFARTFYGIEKDIAKLADILGHSSINTTRIYIATTGAEHRRHMENMGLVFMQMKNQHSQMLATEHN